MLDADFTIRPEDTAEISNDDPEIPDKPTRAPGKRKPNKRVVDTILLDVGVNITDRPEIPIKQNLKPEVEPAAEDIKEEPTENVKVAQLALRGKCCQQKTEATLRYSHSTVRPRKQSY